MPCPGRREQSDPRVSSAASSRCSSCCSRSTSVYRSGEIPDLDSHFATNLFNTYRAAAFELRGPIEFEKRSDPRGSLVEAVKVHGGGGQTFFSTTVPGVTRGEHFHLHKIERFVVIGGQARIQLRKLFSDEVSELRRERRPAHRDRHAHHVAAQHHQHR